MLQKWNQTSRKTDRNIWQNGFLPEQVVIQIPHSKVSVTYYLFCIILKNYDNNSYNNNLKIQRKPGFYTAALNPEISISSPTGSKYMDNHHFVLTCCTRVGMKSLKNGLNPTKDHKIVPMITELQTWIYGSWEIITKWRKTA